MANEDPVSLKRVQQEATGAHAEAVSAHIAAVAAQEEAAQVKNDLASRELSRDLHFARIEHIQAEAMAAATHVREDLAEADLSRSKTLEAIHRNTQFTRWTSWAMLIMTFVLAAMSIGLWRLTVENHKLNDQQIQCTTPGRPCYDQRQKALDDEVARALVEIRANSAKLDQLLAR